MSIWKLTLIGVFSFLFVVVINGSYGFFVPHSQGRFQVLAEEKVDLNGDGVEELVFKTKKNGILYFEVYKIDSRQDNCHPCEDRDLDQNLFVRIPFPNFTDGFIKYKTQFTNLIVEDFNQDGHKDVVIVLYDTLKKQAIKKAYSYDIKNDILVEISI